MPGILMQCFSRASFISDYRIRQLALCVWTFVWKAWTKEVYPALGSSLETLGSAGELRHYSCQRLVMQQGWEEHLGPSTGIRGPKTHYPEWFCKIEQKLCHWEKMNVIASTWLTLRVPAVFRECQICQNTVSLNRLICSEIQQDKNGMLPSGTEILFLL